MKDEDILTLFSRVKAFVFDVDGVFTDNRLYLLESGVLMRAMNARDGYAVKVALEAGYPICVITGGRSLSVKERLMALGIRDVYLGQEDKMEALTEFCENYGLDLSGILYMGDDWPDYECLQRVGTPTCPADAAAEIRVLAKYVAQERGGNGCVREIIEKVLRMAGKWPHQK